MTLSLLAALAFADQPPFPVDPDLIPDIRPHARAKVVAPRGFHRTATPAQLPPPRPAPPERIVYGYQPYWVADSASLPWDELTHVAIFSAGVNGDGTLTDTGRLDEALDAVPLAETYGAKVHLCFTSFDSGDLSTLLGSATNRQRLITAIRAQVDRTGAHGVNIDFEGLPASRKTQMVTFAQELHAEFDEVVFASPAVDWQGAWDYSELTKYAYLFIMGYDYYWSGSDYAGPNDPLYATGTFGQYSLEWTINDYLTYDADPDKTIVGLPLYGRYWRTSSDALHAATLADGETVLFSDMPDEIAAHGARWETGSHSSWVYTGAGQTWAPTQDHVVERAEYAVDQGMAGFGFWALHYDDGDDALWRALGTVSRPGGPADPGDDGDPGDGGDGSGDGSGSGLVDDPGETEVGDPNWTAEAGPPVLARVADTVILSAKGSSGPEGVDKRYRWRQTAGPAVVLEDADTARPKFVVPAVGSYLFEVRVGDGDGVWSSPARSYVVVPNPNVGRQYSPGCDSVGGAPGAVVALAALAAAARRRRR
jgi:uncharacterized protein (TIGR03382 family)